MLTLAVWVLWMLQLSSQLFQSHMRKVSDQWTEVQTCGTYTSLCSALALCLESSANCKAFSSRLLCSSVVRLCTMMSSCMFLAPWQPSKTCWISLWYISGSQLTPDISLLYLKSPLWVAKVAILLDPDLNSAWWNAHFLSGLLKIVLPFRSWRISSTVGMECRSWTIALFTCLMSSQRRMPPLGLGTTTTGEILGVGPSALSITSRSTSSSNFMF